MRTVFLLLVLLLLVAWRGRAWAAPTLSWSLAAMINGNSATTCAPAVPATKSAAVGDELIVFIALGAQTQTMTAPSSSGITWSSAGSSCFNAGGGEEGCVFTGNVTGTQTSGTSYTFTDGTAAKIESCDMFDVAGTNNVVDYVNGTQGTGGATSFSVTPTLSVANDFVALYMWNFNPTQYTSVTFSGGWTGTPTNVNNALSGGFYAAADLYNVQTASGSPTLTISYGTSTWSDYVMVALKPAAGGGGPAFTGFIYAP